MLRTGPIMPVMIVPCQDQRQLDNWIRSRSSSWTRKGWPLRVGGIVEIEVLQGGGVEAEVVQAGQVEGLEDGGSLGAVEVDEPAARRDLAMGEVGGERRRGVGWEEEFEA